LLGHFVDVFQNFLSCGHCKSPLVRIATRLYGSYHYYVIVYVEQDSISSDTGTETVTTFKPFDITLWRFTFKPSQGVGYPVFYRFVELAILFLRFRQQ
jgi:hypothetical protein